MLNADLGESFGAYTLGQDEKLMPFIQQANIACGYHAGDAVVMQKTIGLAKKHSVAIGAHVSYPDLQGFGRRSMQVRADELVTLIHAQISLIDGMSKCQQQSIQYVKPHGALYNDMMKNLDTYIAILKAIASYPHELYLTVQGMPDNSYYAELASKYNVKLCFEAFIDRAYQDNGLLVSRQEPNSVLNYELAYTQAKLLLKEQQVKTCTGNFIKLNIDTLCVHGDNTEALALCMSVSELIKAKHK